MFRFLLDMVHHNPGEAPFVTRFSDPRELAARGYTGQVHKHINAVIRFDSLGYDLWPRGSEEERWLERFTEDRKREIQAAKAANLRVFYHIDLFLLPKKLVEREGDRILDTKGRISLFKERTLELHRLLFEELFHRFPEVDGLIVRVGESYLFDTPYHIGNTAVPMHDEDLPREKQMEMFVALLRFLREEICIRHGRILIHRTWDYFGDRFHAAPDYYLSVTDRIEPHPNLIFSIKHIASDFFRWVRFNPCLGLGKHPQIVEVQCAREYEGKGAYPNYPAQGVLEGFPELSNPIGLREHAARSPLFQGLYTWSRGGGWFGPYLKNEFWPALSLEILARWAREPQTPEEVHFMRHARESLGLDEQDALTLREMAIAANEAVLKGRYCSALAPLTKESWPPTGLWMRDENLGGWSQLRRVFDDLASLNALDNALEEKQECVTLWEAIVAMARSIRAPHDPTLRSYLVTSAEYGLRLFRIVQLGWEILIAGYRKEKGEVIDKEAIRKLGRRYEEAWAHYRALPQERPDCATLYRGEYWNWPGKPPTPGLDAAVADVLASLS